MDPFKYIIQLEKYILNPVGFGSDLYSHLNPVLGTLLFFCSIGFNKDVIVVQHKMVFWSTTSIVAPLSPSVGNLAAQYTVHSIFLDFI